MTHPFRVRVAKDQLGFCSGHFITYDGHHCERLHGHNYRVAVEVAGPLDANHYVFDFIALKKLTREICEELDHRMMLPTLSPLIHVAVHDNQVNVRYETRRWSFPVEDCVLLPVENTTAELLARYIAQRLQTKLRDHRGYQPSSLSVEVEESYGQSAHFQMSETP
jgi:6-pyruvoyltetrahydropterin/6-carboxytetrahydropterin synthase